MKEYQFQIIRYIPDRFAGESVNVGVVLLMPEANFLKAEVLKKFGRLSNFFKELDGYHLLRTLKYFDNAISTISDKISQKEISEDYSDLAKITGRIMQPDDSALICSPVYKGIDIEGQIALDYLYQRMVGSTDHDITGEPHDDKSVWKDYYQKYFDELAISSKLKEHTFQTDADKIHFEKVWKNGAWNLFQPISFDLRRTESIKNKVYKWSDILNDLQKGSEPINLYFLSLSPSKEKSLDKFIEHKLIRKGGNVQADLVTADNAEQFAKGIKEKIEGYHHE
jgi:hypothetical protein